ncbi:ornithine cyclodeaminase family protein [Sphingosinicella rhizophila]|uniref:Ornithine cyclodeaminase family protein n=1 Tax=Sphingosinicella rhizophila TaxID=3050082 RepID=A0ABU3Q991_9SPHN|nr:ornithine cyclodeaminase family protein [Sphingosinicella sp. GR2756]MDT9599973.1 ornithine cyclodeaminase family protein [Sphingosinicella sp. GR2756]
MTILVIGREDVRRELDYKSCIELMRSAMIALSRGETLQIPRQIVRMDNGRMFGVMPGAMGGQREFGAKIVSVFPENHARGLQSHQGPVILFEPETGTLTAIVHAGEITAIRTAAASALATDQLARADAEILAILGYGDQAHSHVRAIREVRKLSQIRVWGRDIAKARAFAEEIGAEVGIDCHAFDSVAEAVRDADIICTTTAAQEPILFAKDVAAGTHVNVVGSSFAGPAEIDNALVLRSRYFADHREHVLAQGAEFIRAREAGLIDEGHLLAEIGEVLDGTKAGRGADDEVTIYKSLGHVVQDLASAWHLYQKASEGGWGTRVAF